LNQDLDGYEFVGNHEDVDDGNNSVPSTSERGGASATLSTTNEEDNLNLDVY
jgi:hypothetical protein